MSQSFNDSLIKAGAFAVVSIAFPLFAPDPQSNMLIAQPLPIASSSQTATSRHRHAFENARANHE
jgi:hypothetical protein